MWMTREGSARAAQRMLGLGVVTQTVVGTRGSNGTAGDSYRA